MVFFWGRELGGFDERLLGRREGEEHNGESITPEKHWILILTVLCCFVLFCTTVGLVFFGVFCLFFGKRERVCE